MKEYTIQEVLQIIEEGQIYKCTRERYNIKFIKKAKTGVKFIYDNKDREALIIRDNARFILVKQQKEISFMEAMKAFYSGKTIKVKYKAIGTNKDKEKTFEPVVSNGIGYLSDCTLSPHLILHGTWFVKCD